ncbi:MAG: zinc ribbon domain-containing protein [Deltaproteobacteria bacterium]|nr:zinc ribbon domain-containing protein [Deltaproteobacteria bacterium]MBW2015540.1 zinc ribbon domain-containing protein [Deltaproteobacteria bacterium]MBW2127860.1 zinc ribbon domain-containing protein [Deltaproteobacteria bacterium]MBW2302888.1 zinc ribbon domain-containing protein [Deltaproteobacteria bacterium]
MPIYEFKCMKCDKEFECIVFGDESDVTCPDCEARDVRRLMSACSFKSDGNFSSSSGSSGCSGCSSTNCSSCH